jgi:hypothetical protein
MPLPPAVVETAALVVEPAPIRVVAGMWGCVGFQEEAVDAAVDPPHVAAEYVAAPNGTPDDAEAAFNGTPSGCAY